MRLLLFLMGRNLDISFISEIIFQNTETYYCQSDTDNVFTPWASIYMKDLKSLRWKIIQTSLKSIRYSCRFPFDEISLRFSLILDRWNLSIFVIFDRTYSIFWCVSFHDKTTQSCPYYDISISCRKQLFLHRKCYILYLSCDAFPFIV